MAECLCTTGKTAALIKETWPTVAAAWSTDLHILVKTLPVPLLEEAEGDALAGDARPQAVERLASLLPGRTPPASGVALPSPSRARDADLTTPWTYHRRLSWAPLTPGSGPEVRTQPCPSLRASKSSGHSCFSPRAELTRMQSFSSGSDSPAMGWGGMPDPWATWAQRAQLGQT